MSEKTEHHHRHEPVTRHDLEIALNGVLQKLERVECEFKHWLKEILRNDSPQRFIRLQIVEVRFVEPSNQTKKDKCMANDNIGIDIPAGKIARLVFQPKTEAGASAKLDGPLTAVVLDDVNLAQVAVGGPDGLTVDIKPLDAVDSVATVEIDGDNNVDPTVREVITTIVTVRRLGEVPGKAVSLGAAIENVTFPAAEQFGVFDVNPPAAGARAAAARR